MTSSPSRFPDGGAYRIEIPSVETAAALRAVLEETGRRGVPIHRVSQGSGVPLLSDAEIRELVAMSRDGGVELCLFLGPRASWDTGGGRLDRRDGRRPRARRRPAALRDRRRACSSPRGRPVGAARDARCRWAAT